jgi:hypothetical protein
MPRLAATVRSVLLALCALSFSATAIAETGTGEQPKASKRKAKAAKKPSASAGATRPAPALDEQQELAYRKHDLDGDGEISKAEAAGSDLINAFDRFDRNKDGKLNRAEYSRAMSAKAKREAASQ